MSKKVNLNRNTVRRNTVLYKAALEVGMDKKQIEGFDSEEALKEAVFHIDPKQRLKFEPPARKNTTLPAPPKPKLEKKSESITINVDALQVESIAHSRAEDMQLQSILRAKGIRKESIRRINISRSCVPDKRGRLISEVNVIYKE